MFSYRICLLHKALILVFCSPALVHMLVAHVYIALPHSQLSQFKRSASSVRAIASRSPLPRVSVRASCSAREGWQDRPVHLSTCLPACLPIYLPTHLPSYLSIYLPTSNDQRAAISVAVMSVRGKQVQNGTYEFDYMRVPDTRTRWKIFRDGIYNPQEGTYCGHPPKKWGESSRVNFTFKQHSRS